MSEALALGDAQARLLALAPLLPLEAVATEAALGRIGRASCRERV